MYQVVAHKFNSCSLFHLQLLRHANTIQGVNTLGYEFQTDFPLVVLLLERLLTC